EDDYDAEFRYDRAPIGALQGLRPDRVVYGGSVSKTLSPILRVGWLRARVADGRPAAREALRRPRDRDARPARAGDLHRERRPRPPSAPRAAGLPAPARRRAPCARRARARRD